MTLIERKKALKRERELAHLTTREVADELHISVATIYAAENINNQKQTSCVSEDKIYMLEQFYKSRNEDSEYLVSIFNKLSDCQKERVLNFSKNLIGEVEEQKESKKEIYNEISDICERILEMKKTSKFEITNINNLKSEFEYDIATDPNIEDSLNKTKILQRLVQYEEAKIQESNILERCFKDLTEETYKLAKNSHLYSKNINKEVREYILKKAYEYSKK